MPKGVYKNGKKPIPPSRKGAKLTAEQKEKMKGKGGELNGFYGKKHTKEAIEKMKETKLKNGTYGKPSRLGQKASNETKKKLSQTHLGERPWMWKNGKISEKTLRERPHKWIISIKGKPKKCEHCGTEQARFFDWSNKNHEYKHIESDWQRLCRKCHIRYDIEHNNLLQKYAKMETKPVPHCFV